MNNTSPSPYRTAAPEPPDIEPGRMEIAWDGSRVILRRAGAVVCTLLRSEARFFAIMYPWLEYNIGLNPPGSKQSLGSGANPPNEQGMPWW